jgi:hypothetical protein
VALKTLLRLNHFVVWFEKPVARDGTENTLTVRERTAISSRTACLRERLPQRIHEIVIAASKTPGSRMARLRLAILPRSQIGDSQ